MLSLDYFRLKEAEEHKASQAQTEHLFSYFKLFDGCLLITDTGDNDSLSKCKQAFRFMCYKESLGIRLKPLNWQIFLHIASIMAMYVLQLYILC